MNDERGQVCDELIAALLGPREPEVTCEECFEQLDRHVDLTLADHGPERGVPGMRAHLEGCPACREDYDSLREYARCAPVDDTAPPAS